MRKFVNSFLEEVKVLALFVIFFTAVYGGIEVVSLIDFSSEESVKEMTEEDLFMQKCMKRMERSSSHLQYHYGICKKRWERKNK